jgi:GNAT superfamily N-acetyltransferase
VAFNRYGTIRMRRARAGDADAIVSVLRAAFEVYRPQYTHAAFDATVLDADRIRERLRQGPAWLATELDVPLGTVAALATCDGVYVRGMAVAPSARGRGIGGALLDSVVRFAVEVRSHRIFLSTTPFLADAIALYERHGFARCPVGPHSLHGTPLFTMERPVPLAEKS